jgi:hypothetical protein
LDPQALQIRFAPARGTNVAIGHTKRSGLQHGAMRTGATLHDHMAPRARLIASPMTQPQKLMPLRPFFFHLSASRTYPVREGFVAGWRCMLKIGTSLAAAVVA